jgi:hypothetical protein
VLSGGAEIETSATPLQAWEAWADPEKIALAWLTVEGAGPNQEVQLWFSTYGVAKNDVNALEARWSKALEQIPGD